MKKEHLIPFEKSKKVIYLDKRGRDRIKLPLSSKVFGVIGVLCLLYCLAIGLFMGYGTAFFLIWGALAAVCGFLAFFLAHKSWVQHLPGWFKVSFVIISALGIALFVFVESLIISQFAAVPEPGADYVVILGAQWKANGPSYVLQKRLDKALEYLAVNPDTRVIVSGGQGSNETMTEAAGMQSYLVAAGIAEERILLEEQSTNTCENLVFSSRLLDKDRDRVVLVTNNFHVFRAVQIAEKQGYVHVEGLAADSYPAMLPNNMLRECLGVMKDFLVGNM